MYNISRPGSAPDMVDDDLPHTRHPATLLDRDDLLVINKPAGVSLLRDRSGEANLWDTLRADHGKLYLVHRLDKGTSGALVLARTQSAQRALTQLFAARKIGKFYLAHAQNRFPTGHTVVIDLPLCKGRKSRYRVAGPRDQIRLDGSRYTVQQDRDGVDAVTRARCLHAEGEGEASLLLLKPATGRTHQLRVHLGWLGYPLLGDHLYNRHADPATPGALRLHCHRLVLPGFATVVAPVPDWCAQAITSVGSRAGDPVRRQPR